MTEEEYKMIQNRIDYRFNNPDLLNQAFTRKSYAEENGGGDNEVLEFIGDKALDFVVVKYLSETYGSLASDCEDYAKDEPNEYFSDLDEGKLSELKARLVQKRMLANRIDKLGFTEFLYMGKGDTEKHLEKQASVKEDLFEAIIGAVALDSNWSIADLENVMKHMLDPEMELDQDENDNYIGKVQDWATKTYGELPLYHTEAFTQGYMFRGIHYECGDNINIVNLPVMAYPKRMCSLKLPGLEQIFFDAGQTDREARRGAAKVAYNYLKKNDLLPTIRDEIGKPDQEEAISQLEILARRGYFSIPTYDFQETHDNNGNPIWSCQCFIKEVKKVTASESSSKRDAKKQAAFKMLQYVLEEC